MSEVTEWSNRFSPGKYCKIREHDSHRLEDWLPRISPGGAAGADGADRGVAAAKKPFRGFDHVISCSTINHLSVVQQCELGKALFKRLKVGGRMWFGCIAGPLLGPEALDGKWERSGEGGGLWTERTSEQPGHVGSWQNPVLSDKGWRGCFARDAELQNARTDITTIDDARFFAHDEMYIQEEPMGWGVIQRNSVSLIFRRTV